MYSFRGVRYATAKRLGRPVMEPDVTSVEDVECREVICPQVPSVLEFLTGPVLTDQEQGEDCLRLGIFTPAVEGCRPVVVFVHGGAFVSGSGLFKIYDGSLLAEKLDAVVVTVSYRLGAFGFLCIPERESVNLGIVDVECAFRWVKRNISKFGGDPERVTAMGQSAGGLMIARIMTSCNEPLFRKANLISAPLNNIMPVSQGVQNTKLFKQKLGCDIDTASVGQMLRAQVETMGATAPRIPFVAVGGRTLRAERMMPGLEEVYMSCAQDDAMPFAPNHNRLLTKLLTNVLFKRPMLRFKKSLEDKGVKVKTHISTWFHDEGPYGTPHCIELPMLFGSWEDAKEVPMLHGVKEEDFVRNSEEACGMLRQFVVGEL